MSSEGRWQAIERRRGGEGTGKGKDREGCIVV